MNITVFLASSPGNDETLEDAIRELGTWIGQSEHTLVYGGSKPGLMGVLAKSALNQGGYVIGIESQLFVDRGVAYDGLSEMMIFENMSLRIRKMVELGDAFIACPGGFGTLEEVSQVMTATSLGIKNAPCIYYNLNGYYDSLKAQLEHMIKAGLSTKEKQQHVYFATSLEEIKEILRSTENEQQRK